MKLHKSTTQGDPADAVIFVLLDAFRADYLTRTRFLKQIAPSSLTGSLQEPFGFCPRGAYFGGLTMAEQGYTNLFRFDPEQSAFRWTRDLSNEKPNAAVRQRLRTQIIAHARAEATSFAAAYLDPLDVPLDRLGYFDVCEQEPPWSRKVGYQSLFHILEDGGHSWLEESWPYVGWSGNLSDGRVAGRALERWTSQQTFAYIHLPDLDLKGHSYGPGSHEVQDALDETDRLCELICSRATELYRDPVILFAGDHGMLPVVRQVDVASRLTDTDLRWGHDIAYFIDSTMVRCWFFTEHARQTARATLTSLAGGHLVTPDEKERWGLTGMDPRNGEEIFLADPGVLFSPNYFDWQGRNTPRGMHGYAPDVADNQAIFLAHWPRRRHAGSVGTVEARQIFPTVLEWIGYDPSKFTQVPPVCLENTPGSTARWSMNGDAESDAVVDGHLARIVTAVRERTPEAEAVILAGGFGRGEGTISRDEQPGRPLNDYDIVVVGTGGAPLAGLEKTLADELGMDFIELWARPTLTPNGTLAQFDYDLRYGSHLLWGNPLVLDRLPRYAPADIGRDEGVFQIGNRSGGVLLGLTGRHHGTDSPDLFLNRQTAKFLIAIADCWLMAQADYHPSYGVRQRRFRDLADGSFSQSVLDSIDAAFTSKLDGSRWTTASELAMAKAASNALDELETTLARDNPSGTLAAALNRSAPRRVRNDSGWLDNAEARGLRASEVGRGNIPGCVAAIYRACVEGLRVWPENKTVREQRIVAALAPEFETAGMRVGLAPAVAETWLAFFH